MWVKGKLADFEHDCLTVEIGEEADYVVDGILFLPLFY